MKRIGILSDTHGVLGEDVQNALKNVDEVWHAGDLGGVKLPQFFPDQTLRWVRGNIDEHAAGPETLRFELEGFEIVMLHDAGRPGAYRHMARRALAARPDILVAGHTHILNITRDENGVLFINPGACGLHGWHAKRTVVRLTLDAGQLRDAEVVELPKDDMDNPWLSVEAFLMLRQLKLSREEKILLGKRSAAACRELGLPIGKDKHPRYGEVNEYPEEILLEAYRQSR